MQFIERGRQRRHELLVSAHDDHELLVSQEELPEVASPAVAGPPTSLESVRTADVLELIDAPTIRHTFARGAWSVPPQARLNRSPPVLKQRARSTPSVAMGIDTSPPLQVPQPALHVPQQVTEPPPPIETPPPELRTRLQALYQRASEEDRERVIVDTEAWLQNQRSQPPVPQFIEFASWHSSQPMQVPATYAQIVQRPRPQGLEVHASPAGTARAGASLPPPEAHAAGVTRREENVAPSASRRPASQAPAPIEQGQRNLEARDSVSYQGGQEGVSGTEGDKGRDGEEMRAHRGEGEEGVFDRWGGWLTLFWGLECLLLVFTLFCKIVDGCLGCIGPRWEVVLTAAFASIGSVFWNIFYSLYPTCPLRKSLLISIIIALKPGIACLMQLP